MQFADFNETTVRQLLIQALDSSFHSIVITSADPGYPITYANPEFCRMTGYELDELIGQSPAIFQGEKTNRKILSRLKSTIASGKAFHGATTNYRKNGEPYPVEWNISPIFDDERKITHYLSIQKDLSGLKDIVSRLKNTNENFREFLADISHRSDESSDNQINEIVEQEKRNVTQALIENSKLYTPALRSTDNVDLFEDDEFFDCSHDMGGMLSEAAIEYERISAQDYASTHHSDNELVQLRDLVVETREKIDLLSCSKNTAGYMQEIGGNLHDIANEVFYFDDFVEISAVLGQLATQTNSHTEEEINPVLVETFQALLSDLGVWIDSVFIEKTAKDIHELDASITSSARQLLFFL